MRYIFIGLTVLVLSVACVVTIITYRFFSDNPLAVSILGYTAVAAGVLTLLALPAGAWSYVAKLWQRTDIIQPDENGDLPMLRIGNTFVNPNALPYGSWQVDRRGNLVTVGAPDARAHAAWRLTSGKFGSVPRDAFEGEGVRMLPQPTTRLLEPGDAIPPILIEARTALQ